MPSVGSYNSQYVQAMPYVHDRDILRDVLDVTREQLSFMEMMDLMGRTVETKTPQYHHHTNTERFSNIVAAVATDTSSGTDGSVYQLQLSAADYDLVKEGDTVICPNKKVGYVRRKYRDDVGGDAAEEYLIDVHAVDGGDMDLSNSDKVAIFGNASGAGSGAPQPMRWGTQLDYNQIQIIKGTFEIDDIEAATDVTFDHSAEPKLFHRGRFLAARHFRDMEALTFWFMRRSASVFGGTLAVTEPTGAAGTYTAPTLTDINGKPVQTTRGINEYIEQKGITFTGSANQNVSLANYADLVRQLAAERAPRDYIVYYGIEGAIAHTDTFINLPSSAAFSDQARLMVDGKELDLGLNALTIYDYKFNYKKLDILDHKVVMNFSGSAGFQNRMFFIPNDKIKGENGTTHDRLRVRYMRMPKGLGVDNQYRELELGGLASTPTSADSVFQVVFECRKGPEILGAQHFAIWEL